MAGMKGRQREGRACHPAAMETGCCNVNMAHGSAAQKLQVSSVLLGWWLIDALVMIQLHSYVSIFGDNQCADLRPCKGHRLDRKVTLHHVELPLKIAKGHGFKKCHICTGFALGEFAVRACNMARSAQKALL